MKVNEDTESTPQAMGNSFLPSQVGMGAFGGAMAAEGFRAWFLLQQRIQERKAFIMKLTVT